MRRGLLILSDVVTSQDSHRAVLTDIVLHCRCTVRARGSTCPGLAPGHALRESKFRPEHPQSIHTRTRIDCKRERCPHLVHPRPRATRPGCGEPLGEVCTRGRPVTQPCPAPLPRRWSGWRGGRHTSREGFSSLCVEVFTQFCERQAASRALRVWNPQAAASVSSQQRIAPFHTDSGRNVTVPE